MKLPLANYRAAGDPLLLGPQGVVGAGAFFQRAAELAAALPDTTYVINLAESRLGFMLGFAAALLRGQSSLLPSGHGSGELRQLQKQHPRAVIISDATVEVPGLFDIFDVRPFLALKDSPPTMNVPTIDSEMVAAILFTSGSTGQPTAHAKSWRQLSAGASSLAAALARQAPPLQAVVGSVPPQHMFGLETTVMLPWLAGVPVHGGRPLLPGDLEIAIEQCSRPCWWMTTPLHLRPSLHAACALPDIAGIVASTMSLPPAMARDAEQKWQVPVIEIYGSTETGALATRRTAGESLWTPLDDVQLVEQTVDGQQQIVAGGGHIADPVLLGDELRIESDGRFQWLGRSADVIKIGGKRASLAALNQQIGEIAGVDDAVYFVADASSGAAAHDAAHPPRRLAAFYVSASLTPRELQNALRTLVDPVFVPRPLYRIARLPRNDTGKIPHAALAELFRQMSGGDSSVDSSRLPPTRVVAATHPALPGHFPGNAIVPGAMIISQIEEDIRLQFPGFVPDRLLSMRFHRPLRPDQAFAVRAQRRNKRVMAEVYTAGTGADELLASGQWASSHDDAD